jgi:hypothetical protein
MLFVEAVPDAGSSAMDGAIMLFSLISGVNACSKGDNMADMIPIEKGVAVISNVDYRAVTVSHKRKYNVPMKLCVYWHLLQTLVRGRCRVSAHYHLDVAYPCITQPMMEPKQ